MYGLVKKSFDLCIPNIQVCPGNSGTYGALRKSCQSNAPGRMFSKLQPSDAVRQFHAYCCSGNGSSICRKWNSAFTGIT